MVGYLLILLMENTRFELTKIDPVLYSQIRYLEADEISNPLIDEDQSGNKNIKF